VTSSNTPLEVDEQPSQHEFTALSVACENSPFGAGIALLMAEAWGSRNRARVT